MRRVALAALVAIAVLSGAPTASAYPPLPPDFRWGVANSAFQTEGPAIASNWGSYIEQGRAGPIFASVDFRHRYPEDIERARRLGLDTFRLGINWARVEPREGEWDEGELAYYDDLIRTVVRAGMTPMITLDHYAYPKWILDRGGWDNAATSDAFVRYARRMVERYRGLRAYWITFNEVDINVKWELEKRQTNPVLMNLNITDAHRRTYGLIHELDPTTRGVTSTTYWLGVRGDEAGGDTALLDTTFIDQVAADSLDFIGLDYYYRLDTPQDFDNLFASRNWLVDLDPAGLYGAIKHYATKFPDKPIFVTENGMATDDGNPRPDGYRRCQHLADHVQQVQRAVAEGIDVPGYLYWSITDNYEWGEVRSRFGLYTVDIATDPALRRRATDGVATYRHVIARRGVSADYVPVKTEAGFADGYRDAPCLSSRVALSGLRAQGRRVRFRLDRPAVVRLRLQQRRGGRWQMLATRTVRGLSAGRQSVRRPGPRRLSGTRHRIVALAGGVAHRVAVRATS